MKRITGVKRIFIGILTLIIFVSLFVNFNPVQAGNIRVPEDYPTIQAAINAALTGDVVLVGPGTYNENLVIAGKTITLASLYYTTGDRQYIDSTIINGQQLGPVITIDKTAGQTTTIQGLTISNGMDGIATFTKSNIFDNRIINNSDGIDNTNGGGIFRGNIFENNTDDGIDFDKASEGIIENNIIRNNWEDGFEMRLEDYTGPTLHITLRNNQFYGNHQDGIQLIGGLTTTPRAIYIHHNLFDQNLRAGVGLLDNLYSGEDYRAASLLERIEIYNNTFTGNNYAISGGDNLAAVNNVIVNSATLGIKNIDGGSIVSRNLFWNNGIDQIGSNLDQTNIIGVNPLLGLNGSLNYGSSAIDAGVASFVFTGETVFDYTAGSFFGTAPDLGWLESNYLNEPTATNTITPSPTSTPRPGDTFTYTPLDDATINSTYPTSNYGSAVTLNVDNSPVQNFLIKFQVDGLGGRPVTKATLQLFNINESSIGGYYYQVINNSWVEETVNWNNAPAASTTLVASLGTVAVGNWYSLDLTSLISGDGIYTLRVTSTSTNGADFSSKEGSNSPILEVVVSGGSTATPGTVTATATPTISLTPTASLQPTYTFTPAPSATPLPSGNIRFAAFGDYGDHSQSEADVAALVHSWYPDLIVTTGDNNYPLGASETIDGNVGRYYHDFIFPYLGNYGIGAATNRFFPSLGNHDMDTNLGQPSIDYFSLPGNERYYDFVYGPVHFFILNSDPREPDGVSSTSLQALWLQNRLADTTSAWQVVVFHHAAYSSGSHGSSTFMRWPFAEWGVDAVLSGHDHTYERLDVGGIPYFVSGIGGDSAYAFVNILPESVVRYNSSPGALLVEANADQLRFSFYSAASLLIDSFTLYSESPPTTTPQPTSTFTSTPTNSPIPTSTFTSTATNSPLPTSTFTTIPSASTTAVPSATFTATTPPTATNMVAPTLTFTPTNTLTFTPSPTLTTSPTASVTRTSSPTATLTLTPTANASIPDQIFNSNFDQDGFSDWSSSVSDSGDLSISPAAALVGPSGMAALVDDKRAIYVSDASPAAESHYRARFYLDPNGLTLSSIPITVFYGFTGSSTQVLRVELRFSGGTYQVRAGLRNDGNTWLSTGWTNLSDASHYLELDWLAATSVSVNNGGLTFWVDGNLLPQIIGVDNDKRRIDMVRLGVLAGIESSTRGLLYLDAFDSHRTTFIGP